jgi:hypothetical protein
LILSLLIPLLLMRIRQVYMTMLFEWVPKSTPGYRAALDNYVDVTNCGFSSFPARTGVYTKKGNPWTMRENAHLLFATGHVHGRFRYC